MENNLKHKTNALTCYKIVMDKRKNDKFFKALDAVYKRITDYAKYGWFDLDLEVDLYGPEITLQIVHHLEKNDGFHVSSDFDHYGNLTYTISWDLSDADVD